MPVGVDRLAADHADRPPGAHDFPGALGEGPGGAHRHLHPQHLFGVVALVVLIGEESVVVLLHLPQGVGLDDELRRRRVPAQAHHAGSELFLHRLEVVIVDQFEGSAGGNVEGVTVEGEELVEDLVDLLGELGRLLLLHGDADDLLPGPHLPTGVSSYAELKVMRVPAPRPGSSCRLGADTRNALPLRREGIVSGPHSVVVANLSVSAMDANLATTLVMNDRLRALNGVRLRASMCTGPLCTRRLDVPATPQDWVLRVDCSD